MEGRVDMERELSDPLGYGEGRDSECDVWFGLLAEAGGVRGSSLCFQKPGIGPKGSRQVDVRRGVKGPGDNGVEAEIELLNLLGKEGP